MVTPEPLGVQKHNVPIWKSQLSLCLEQEAQGHSSTSALCHTLLKKAILHYTSATVPFDLNIAVTFEMYLSRF